MKGKVQFYKDKKEEYRWRLLASNGRQIANGGEGYTTFENCKKGYESVKKHAQDAVEDVQFD
ncbi:MAG: DUF1508 domain-containing protein [bacterium]|nr:DUF1508 domain-containing protein [bacterium]